MAGYSVNFTFMSDLYTWDEGEGFKILSRGQPANGSVVARWTDGANKL
jgi:hypothetical protein